MMGCHQRVAPSAPVVSFFTTLPPPASRLRVRHSALTRAIAVLLALLAGGSAAGSAVAHGWAHAEEHHDGIAHHDAPADAPLLRTAPAADAGASLMGDDVGDGHRLHADVGAALRGRWDLPDAAEVPTSVVARSAETELTLISVPPVLSVRGDPSSGPPPPLRSPPSI